MNVSNQKVVTRFAPSPTGFLHLGNYRTAIFAYLYAKKCSGSFILRIEDTDRERSKKEYEDNIINSLDWLGIKYDKFYRQSEQVERHKFYLEKLIRENKAYISKEEAKDGSGIIKELVRFKNPNVDVTFFDEIKGNVTMNTEDLGDFVIAKNLNEPLFHLAVVVDDYEAMITHVIRGEDHVSNTPRQVLIQKAIGAPTPIYAHLPLVLGPDRLKLSKRRGALSLTEYAKQGYLPEAILNGVAFIGWNPGTDKELFTRDELIGAFELNRVQKSPAIFNEEKLEWFNKEHMRKMPADTRNELIIERMKNNARFSQNPKINDKKFLIRIAEIIFDHISKWGDIDELAGAGELDYYFTSPQYDKNLLSWKGSEPAVAIKKHLEYVKNVFAGADDEIFSFQEKIKNLIFDYATENGRGEVLWPLRVALSGKERSPNPFSLIYALGKQDTLFRIEEAIEKI